MTPLLTVIINKWKEVSEYPVSEEKLQSSCKHFKQNPSPYERQFIRQSANLGIKSFDYSHYFNHTKPHTLHTHTHTHSLVIV